MVVFAGTSSSVYIPSITQGTPQHTSGRFVGTLSSFTVQTYGTLRGDAYGVMFSNFDTTAGSGDPVAELSSDTQVNALADGHNSVWFIAFPPGTTSGNFTLTITNPGYGNTWSTDPAAAVIPGGEFFDPARQQNTANITWDNNPQTLWNNIINAINATAVSFGGAANPFGTPPDPPGPMRLVSHAEIMARQPTYWGLDKGFPAITVFPEDPLGNGDRVYEFEFQNRAHDTDIFVSVASSTLNAGPPIVSQEIAGDPGTMKTQESMAITRQGSLVAAWMQYDRYTDTDPLFSGPSGFPIGTSNIYFREYQENTDTAGPLVTDFILPWGQQLPNNAQVNRAVQYLVVPFDEEMMQGTSAGSVTNPNNWVLLKDGVNISGGIQKIWFGMNKAADMAGALGLDPVGTNKWEAVLELDGDGVTGSSVVPLTNGHYQIVALESMKDKAGNPLGRTGFNPNGLRFSQSFDILIPNNPEVQVNSDPPVRARPRTHPPRRWPATPTAITWWCG